jgi:hypothetical protein
MILALVTSIPSTGRSSKLSLPDNSQHKPSSDSKSDSMIPKALKLLPYLLPQDGEVVAITARTVDSRNVQMNILHDPPFTALANPKSRRNVQKRIKGGGVASVAESLRNIIIPRSVRGKDDPGEVERLKHVTLAGEGQSCWNDFKRYGIDRILRTK